ncbi:MAG: dihydrofolate reductase [Spirochaetes bacterium]|nr:dihydrofolate reductase [Spirochaetota bacterium]
MQEIIIIAAMAENRVIGKDGVLPWSVKEDLARFKEITAGYPCVMGRRTWESLPRRPLPGRPNIVVSRTMPAGAAFAGAEVVPSLEAAIEACRDYDKVFICGGAAIYADALSLANKIDLTIIPGRHEGDVFFPPIDEALWEKTAHEHFDKFSCMSYAKIVPGKPG